MIGNMCAADLGCKR